MAAPACCGRRRSSCCSTTSSAPPICRARSASMPPRAISACWSGRRWAASSCSAFGPARGILLNTLFYLPLVLWLVNAPYGPRFRTGAPPPRRAVRGLADIIQTMRDIRDHPSSFDGAACRGCVVLRRQCLQLANAGLRRGSRPRRSGPGLQHAARGRCLRRSAGRRRARKRRTLPPRPRTAIVLALFWCFALVGFACRRTIRWRSACCSPPASSNCPSTPWRKPGAAQCAAGNPRTRHRPVQHGKLGPAHLQRRLGRAGRQPDRRALVAGGLGARHAGDGRGAAHAAVELLIKAQHQCRL